MANWESLRADFLEMLLDSEIDHALSMARAALSQGNSPSDFFEKCITPVLEEIGDRFERLEIYLPEMVEAAEIVEQLNLQVIQPEVEKRKQNEGATDQTVTKAKVLLATVQGDLHDIGKSMVSLMLTVNGFEVCDIGIDVPPTDIVNRAQQENVDIIGLSSLLTTCLPYMKDVIEFLQGVGSREKFAVIVGGAAVTPKFAEEIGADAFGQSAAEAVKICNKIMNSRASHL